MVKVHSKYVCQQCGYETAGWLGKCPNCGSWGSLVETFIQNSKTQKIKESNKIAAKPVSLSSIPSRSTSRISTKISELDRVLGGGLVPGQVVLIAGEPGIGKSTLLLQLADKIGDSLFILGEESVGQIKVRAERLGIKNKSLKFLEETDVDVSVGSIELEKLVVVDSIQTMSTQDLTGLAGSVGQVRECAYRLLKAAKEKNIPLFLVGHVTKEGTVAGPAVLAHVVDTLLWFEGDKSLTLRLLRAVKNRFGPTDEVGIFQMEDKGLIPAVNIDKIFLSKGKLNVPGSVVTSTLQGTRPILVEIQALAVASKMPFPKRVAQGVDLKRLELLLAVLIRRCGLPLYDYDVFVNVAGGIKVVEPSSDLAICLAVASSYFDKALPKGILALGEVGLLGEIREVVAQEKRIKEAKRMGLKLSVSEKEVSFVNQAIKKYLR